MDLADDYVNFRVFSRNMIQTIVIFVYLSFLIAVGFWRKKDVKTQEDFVVAGRRLTAPILVGTLLATWTGSGSIFNGGRLAYENGFAALWSSAGAWIGILVIYFIARKVRAGSRLSVPQILEERYNSKVGLFAMIATVIAYVTIVSYQFRGGGIVINLIAGDQFTLFGLSPELTGIVITAVFAISYTMIAGMISVTYTDVINGIIMLVGISLAIPFALKMAGGVETFVASVPQEKWNLFGSMGGIKAFGYLLPTMFLLMGDANMYQRFLSAKNEFEAQKSVVGWIVGVIIIEILIVTLGFLGTGIEPGLAGTESANIILLIGIKHLPVIISCLLLSAVIAIIISTADSFLLVPATNLSHDLYQKYLRPNASQRELLTVCRIGVLVLGLLAFLMVSYFDSILSAAYAAYTIYGASVTPALLAGFLWKRANSKGAMSSIIGGTTVTISWELVKKITGETPFGIDAIYPALIVSVLLLIYGSLLTSTTPSPQKT